MVGGPYDRLVIQGATLIDGTGGPPVAPVDIVVEGGTITDVRRVSALDLARGADRASGERTIDARGMWVMPGIIDAHTHLGHGDEIPGDYIPKLWLGHGITTVRTFTSGGGDPAIEIARRQDAGEEASRGCCPTCSGRSARRPRPRGWVWPSTSGVTAWCPWTPWRW